MFIWWPVPNGTYSSPIHKKNMKTAGELKPGVQDIMVHYGGRLYGFELKTMFGKVSKEQQAWHNRCQLAGVPTMIIRDFDAFVHNITLVLKERI
jgi:hypothetical protein